MTSGKKKRLSMLDSLAAAGAASAAAPKAAPEGTSATVSATGSATGQATGSAPPAPSPTPASPMMASNRALRSARDAVDAHRVWDLDPAQIVDDRPGDRLDPSDVADLRDAIEANGQTVPILVRRHPSEPDRYRLVYGRRRLEAIRASDTVRTVRALVAALDEDGAIRAQISENMARRDLSFIEKALFAKHLVENGFGTQTQVAEVLTVAKSAISMALGIVDLVGEDLARTIGPAHGVGRPRWEALGKAMAEAGHDPARYLETADRARDAALIARAVDGDPAAPDPSVAAFEAVERAVAEAVAAVPRKTSPASVASPARAKAVALSLDGRRGGTVTRTRAGLAITLADGAFADWVEAEAQNIINELHARWTNRRGE